MKNLEQKYLLLYQQLLRLEVLSYKILFLRVYVYIFLFYNYTNSQRMELRYPLRLVSHPRATERPSLIAENKLLQFFRKPFLIVTNGKLRFSHQVDLSRAGENSH